MAHARRPMCGWRMYVPLAAALAAVLVFSAISNGSEAPSISMTVSVDQRHPGRPVPRRFLGLSFELSSLGQLAALADRGDLVTLLRSLGPGVLRFGGISADTRVAWVDAHTPKPQWASSTLDAHQLRALRALAVRSGWRVLLTLNLAHYDPRAGAREAAAAYRALGPWLAGVEVGNEPDAYTLHGVRASGWNAQQFAGEVVAYRRAIRALAPRVALAGPDASGSGSFGKWAPLLARAVHTSLLTGHHYALGCHELPPPSIERLLSFRVQELESRSLAHFMRVSKQQRIRFRLDEANSVSCGGAAEVSDTLASALWAVDYIGKLMAAGASGINLHGNLSRCDGYSPLCAQSATALARGQLLARPVWYALLLSRYLVGERPLRTAIAPRGPNISALALRAPDGMLRFVLIDREPSASAPAAMTLRVGRAYARGEALALTARSLASTSGVRLGARAVSADGSWRAPSPLPAIPVRGGALRVTMPAGSAVLVSVTRRSSGS